MNNEIEQAIQKLVELIKYSDSYKKYYEFKNEVENDRELNTIFYSYKAASKPLQLAAINNTEPSEESLNAFKNISNMVFSDEILSNFISYDMQVKKLLGEIIEKLTDNLKIEY